MSVYLWRDLEINKVTVKDDAGNTFDVPWQVDEAYKNELRQTQADMIRYHMQTVSLMDKVKELEAEIDGCRKFSANLDRENFDLVERCDDLEEENTNLRCLVIAWSKLYDMAPYANKVVETMVLRGRIDEMMRDLDFAPADEVEE